MKTLLRLLALVCPVIFLLSLDFSIEDSRIVVRSPVFQTLPGLMECFRGAFNIPDPSAASVGEPLSFEKLEASLPDPDVPVPGTRFKVREGDTLYGLAEEACDEPKLWYGLLWGWALSRPEDLQAGETINFPTCTDMAVFTGMEIARRALAEVNCNSRGGEWDEREGECEIYVPPAGSPGYDQEDYYQEREKRHLPPPAVLIPA